MDFESDDLPIEDTITQSQRESTQISRAFDVDNTCDVTPYRQLRNGVLPLLQLVDWDKNRIYNEQQPTCVHYSIEWKLTVNGKQVAKQTEPNLVLAPNPFWITVLERKLKKLLARKFPNRSLRADDITVAVSVTDRTERDLHLHFLDLDIDWAAIETQLQSWSHLLRIRKKLRIDMSFHYMEINGVVISSERGTKRRYPSATQDMLAERDIQLNAEEDSTDRSSIWRDVYNLMRCPGPPCNLGPHCWIDNVGKKHYKLKTHHLESLIMHLQRGGKLQSHNDAPNDIREQLYAEEQQDVERQRKRRAPSLASLLV